MRIESDDAAHLDWLREFLTPSFDAVEVPRPTRTVRLVTDPVRHADTIRRGPDPGGQDIPCFWLDTGVVRLPQWTAAEKGVMVFDRQSGAFYTLGRGRVDILTAGGGLAVRSGLMRVVREPAMAEARRQGGLVLHAAAVAVGERVILIAGPKGAGKTTLLVHLLRAAGALFVANDRVVLPADGPVPTVRGLPTIVKLLCESAGWFPDLRARLEASRFHHRLTLTEARRRPHGTGTVAPNGFWSLSPAQFCSLLETRPAAGGRLEAIVLPRLTGAPGRAALRRLSLAEAAAAIAGAQLGRRVPLEDGAPDWMSDGEPRDVSVPTREFGTGEARCRKLAERIPVFACNLGRDVYDDLSSVRRLLEVVSA